LGKRAVVDGKEDFGTATNHTSYNSLSRIEGRFSSQFGLWLSQ
jgi:hypothetical protein